MSWIPDMQCCFKKYQCHHVFSLTCMPWFCICERGSHIWIYRLQWTIRQKTWSLWCSLKQHGMLGLWDTWITFYEQYRGILLFYYSFYLFWILVTIYLNCLGDKCKLFSSEKSTVFCKLKTFTHSSICMSVRR